MRPRSCSRVSDTTTVVQFLSKNPDPDSPLDIEKEQDQIYRSFSDRIMLCQPLRSRTTSTPFSSRR